MQALIDFFKLQDAQRDAALTRGADVAVMAGAGSGKTRTLAARFITLLGENHRPRALAAITFTEKAAREMRNRIRAEIAAWRAGACPPDERAFWADVEAEIDTARIGTIHGLCAAILRAHPAEAGIDPRFAVLDEGQALQLRDQVADRAAQWAGDQPRFGPLFDAFGAEGLQAVLVTLLENRLDADTVLTRPDAATAWEATALREVREFVAACADPLAELRSLQSDGRLKADAGDKLLPQALAFIAAWDQAEAALAGGALWPALAAVFAARRECGGSAGLKTSRARAALRAVKEAYDARLNGWLGGAQKADPPPDSQTEADTGALLALLAEVYGQATTAFLAEKDIRQALDFDDLEYKATELLRQVSIRGRWQSQIDALLIDEFQDTNGRQREIVEALAGATEDRRGRLFIVGDAKQSIYRFRGADVGVFRDLGVDIVDRGGLALTLDRTYRAHAPLVAAINDLTGAVLDGVAPGPSRIPFAPLHAGRSSAPRLVGPHIRFVAAQGETGVEGRALAATALARELADLAGAGVRWDEIALLFRASTGFPYYEAALETAGIPFVTVAGRGFFDRPEIRDLVNVLAAIADPWDDLALTGALRSPMFGLSDGALYTLRWPVDRPGPVAPWAAIQADVSALEPTEAALTRRAAEILTALHAAVDRVSVAELIKRLLDETQYVAALAGVPGGARLRRNLDKLLADAHASGITQLTDFLDQVQSLRDVGAREGEAPSDAAGAVRLLTVHKAKGLEFPVVVLADAGYSPRVAGGPLVLTRELGPALAPPRVKTRGLAYRLAMHISAAHEDAEEARLLYVAATRAQEMLLVSGHLARRGATWLTTLGAAAGLDFDACAAQPGLPQTASLPCGEPVSAVVYAAVEPTTVDPLQPDVGTDTTPVVPLTAPVRRAGDARKAAGRFGRDGVEERSHRTTRRLAQVDGTIVGNLVHEAVRRWRFPGDIGFAELLAAAARAARLIDMEQVGPHVERATELLERLRAEPAWADLNAAHRDGRLHHEVPYAQSGGGAGVIDVLYQDALGQWQIVDFKTDALARLDDGAELIRDDYGPQLRRYIDAVNRLLGRPATARLCWLDVAGAVAWQTVSDDPV